MKKLLLTLAMTAMLSYVSTAQEASYENPIGLRYLGTITNPDPQPTCSYATRNPMNQGAFYWMPVGRNAKYTDNSAGAPKSWKWDAKGGEIFNNTAQDALVQYLDKGVYNFPALTTTYADGTTDTYAPEYKLKVGGVAELCLADTREWMTTYALGVASYDAPGVDEKGCLGGTNSLNIAGVGNLYMTSIEDGFLDGVNVYLQKKPTKWKEGANVMVRVWMAAIGDQLQLAAVPIEGSVVPFEKIKTEEDGVWVPIEDGAVIQVKFETPVDLYGKQLLFIDVAGWSYDPTTEDFEMLMDVMPNKEMKPEDADNMLAHNSFVRLDGEPDYLRPVSYFGGNYGSFMICPVVRGAETPSSINEVRTENEMKMHCVVDGNSVIFSANDGILEIYNTAGVLYKTTHIINGTATVSDMLPGIYIARNATRQAVKFVIK